LATARPRGLPQWAGFRLRYNRCMAKVTEKERFMATLRELPEDATVADAIERLLFMAKIEGHSSIGGRAARFSRSDQEAISEVMSLLWTARAADDLAAIRDFIRRDSERYAEAV